MISGKKNLAFTIAFGELKYKSMAEICKKSFEQKNPNIEFKIFSDGDFTPYKNIGKKLVHPKDFKYPKLELFTKLKESIEKRDEERADKKWNMEPKEMLKKIIEDENYDDA